MLGFCACALSEWKSRLRPNLYAASEKDCIRRGGLYCIHRADAIEHVGLPVKISTGRHKGVINKAISEIVGAQSNVAVFTSALTKANSGEQSPLFYRNIALDRKFRKPIRIFR